MRASVFLNRSAVAERSSIALGLNCGTAHALPDCKAIGLGTPNICSDFRTGAHLSGGAFGAAWASHGPQVFFGVRNPDSAEAHALLKRSGRISPAWNCAPPLR